MFYALHTFACVVGRRTSIGTRRQRYDRHRTEHYMPIVELISATFSIPQLEKERKVWAILPHDYYTSSKRYPVLYLQDAQNLFDESAPMGSWSIRRVLGDLAATGNGDIIIIAVDHGGSERIKEYSPYFHRKFGKGEGLFYAEFIFDSLKPYIDKHFRTKAHRDFSGIGGSSMGGLISAYIGLVHAEHFSKLMIFSPSFWYSDDIYFDAFNRDYTHHLELYIYAGEKESETMTKHINKFTKAVRSNKLMDGKNKFRVNINPEGRHQERFWRDELPKAIKWLYFRDEQNN